MWPSALDAPAEYLDAGFSSYPAPSVQAVTCSYEALQHSLAHVQSCQVSRGAVTTVLSIDISASSAQHVRHPLMRPLGTHVQRRLQLSVARVEWCTILDQELRKLV
jgi:hypothetical protein